MSENTSKTKKGPDWGSTNSQEHLLELFEKRMDDIVKLSDSVRTINTSMQSLTKEVAILKRKAQENVTDLPSKCQKNSSVEADSDNEELDSSLSEEDDYDIDATMDTIDNFLEQKRNDDNPSTSTSMLEDLTDFFAEDIEVGDRIDETLAKIVNQAITQRPNIEKIKQIQEKHKRPENTERLQVPKVPEMLWQDLKPHQKAMDYNLQRCHATLASATVPLIKALGRIQNSHDTELQELLKDSFKLLTNGISGMIETRRERLQKTVKPKYKEIAKQKATAEHLFGEKFNETVKSLDAQKIHLTQTVTTPNNRPFLGQRPFRGRPFPRGNRHLPRQKYNQPGPNKTRPFRKNQIKR